MTSPLPPITPGLFAYPAQAAFGRVLPKNKIFTHTRASRRVQDAFARDITRIVWSHKLAPATLNLPATADVPELQIFSIELKPGIDDLDDSLLRCIDQAIRFPIIFEVTADPPGEQRLKVVAAYKRPSEADSSKWVIGDYHATPWLAAGAPRGPLPVALNLTSLYEQMLRPLVPLKGRADESLSDLLERQALVVAKRRELARLGRQLAKERQFNRKVEINACLRSIKSELEELTDDDVR